jgi:hypothetical protein
VLLMGASGVQAATPLLNVKVVASSYYVSHVVQMRLLINGAVAGVGTVSTQHSSGQWQTLTFNVPRPANLSSISVGIYNGATGPGIGLIDGRLLYIQNIVVGGATLTPSQGLFGGVAGTTIVTDDNDVLDWGCGNGNAGATCSPITLLNVRVLAASYYVSKVPVMGLYVNGTLAGTVPVTRLYGQGTWQTLSFNVPMPVSLSTVGVGIYSGQGGNQLIDGRKLYIEDIVVDGTTTFLPSQGTYDGNTGTTVINDDNGELAWNVQQSPPPPTNGQCGSANGTTVSSAPTTNLCSAGTATSVTGSGPWYWNCDGTNGGTNASCSANVTGGGGSPFNGACGSAAVPSTTEPTTNLCATGTPSAVTPTAGGWWWTCDGSDGGTNVNCSASLEDAPVNGTCGSAAVPSTTEPTTNLCSAGTPTSVTPTAGGWWWTCDGSNNGTNINCSASLIVNGVCGSANGTPVSTAPTTNLCSAGTPTAVTGSGPWSWNCDGANTGTNASCSAPKSNATVQKPGPSAALFANPPYACVRNYYVAPAPAQGGIGSDSNNGTSPSTPWTTIAHADAQNLGGGTCVNFAAGLYPLSFEQDITNGGTSSNFASGSATQTNTYLVYRCETLPVDGGTSNCHFQASTGLGQYNMLIFLLKTANYVMFDGFEFDGNGNGTTSDVNTGDCFASTSGHTSPHTGTTGPGHHIWIMNSIAHDCGGAGISFGQTEWAWTLHNITRNNSYYDTDGGVTQESGIDYVLACNIGASCWVGTNPSSGIYTPTAFDQAWSQIGSTVYHNVIMWNVTHDNTLQPSDNTFGQAATDGNCLILDSFNNNSYPAYSLVAFNVSYHCGGRAFHIFSSDNVAMYNNTAFDSVIDYCLDQGFGAGARFGDINDYGSNNGTYVNNIGDHPANYSGNAATNCPSGSSGTWTTYVWGLFVGGGTQSGMAFTNDLAYGGNPSNTCGGTFPGSCETTDNGGTFFSCTSDMNTCTSNPGFVNATAGSVNHNFALAGGSAAIGAGIQITFPWDPQATAQSVDVGACFHTLTTCP